MSDFSDVSTMMQLLLLEDAEKHGLAMESVRCYKVGQYAEVRVKFDSGAETRVGERTSDNAKDLLTTFLDLARSKRGKFQLWTSPRRATEYQAGLAAMAEKLGISDDVSKISALAKDFNPEECVTRKVGRTPGGRTYEVVDGPWGRRVIVVDEANETACQRGPFVKCATRIYKLADPGGMNGNTSKAKGWVRRARLYVKPRTKCRFLEAFVGWTQNVRPYPQSEEGHSCSWNFALSDEGQRLIKVGGVKDPRLPASVRARWESFGKEPIDAALAYFSRQDKLIAMVPVIADLAKTHDPAAVPLRARRLALLAAEIATHGEVLPDLRDWKKKHKLAFPLEHNLFKRAWSLSYYEDSVTKAWGMYGIILQMFQNDEAKWQQLADRFKEVV